MVPHAKSLVSMQGVQENAAATLRQTNKNNANPKSNCRIKQSCGAVETATPT